MRKIYDYTCYRELVSDVLTRKNITLSSVATRLGLKSKNYVGMILRGEKRLQVEQVHSLKEILDLTSAEFDYFFHLVIFCDTDHKKVRQYHKEKLNLIRSAQLHSTPMQAAKEEVLSQWFYPAILLNLSLSQPHSDAQLAETLGIPVSALVRAYQDLADLQLIRKTEAGPWEKQKIRIKVAKKSWSQIQKRFLKSQLQNTLQIFDRSYEKSGKFYSQTITFSKDSFEQVWDSLKNQMDNLADRSDSEKPEELCQLNLQFYKV